MLDGTNKKDGCWVRARRKPQRYPQVSLWFGNATMAQKTRFYVPDSVQHCTRIEIIVFQEIK